MKSILETGIFTLLIAAIIFIAWLSGEADPLGEAREESRLRNEHSIFSPRAME